MNPSFKINYIKPTNVFSKFERYPGYEFDENIYLDKIQIKGCSSDIRVFGVIADGINDDTIAFQKAIDWAESNTNITEGPLREIFIPEGLKIRTTSSLIISKPCNVNIKSYIFYDSPTGSCIILGNTGGTQNTNYNINIAGLRCLQGNNTLPTSINNSGNNGIELRNVQFSNINIGKIIAFTNIGFYGNCTGQANIGFNGQVQQNNIYLGEIAYNGYGFLSRSLSAELASFQANYIHIQDSFANYTNFQLDDDTFYGNSNNNYVLINALDQQSITTTTTRSISSISYNSTSLSNQGVLLVSNTSGLKLGQTIIFDVVPVGSSGITIGQVYYIINIVTNISVTISPNYNGSALTPTAGTTSTFYTYGFYPSSNYLSLSDISGLYIDQPIEFTGTISGTTGVSTSVTYYIISISNTENSNLIQFSTTKGGLPVPISGTHTTSTFNIVFTYYRGLYIQGAFNQINVSYMGNGFSFGKNAFFNTVYTQNGFQQNPEYKVDLSNSLTNNSSAQQGNTIKTGFNALLPIFTTLANNTVYQNLYGCNIQISFSVTCDSTESLSLNIGSSSSTLNTACTCNNGTANTIIFPFSSIIPAGWYYNVTFGGTPVLSQALILNVSS
jgi:hypothetical protein